METILWHDYETSGADPAWDRPVQFAAQRTTLDLEPVGPPVEYLCRLPGDAVPSPDAVVVTGISPLALEQRGSSERDFCASVVEAFSVPGTCGAGYNSIRFDDEFTRHMLFRNFYDPYAREWRDGNSRWDLIDVVRLVEATRPEGIEWPTREDGEPSFRLEALTAANGIEHSGAHDALVDVRATISLAGLVRRCQPDLYDYCWKLRRKAFVAQQIDLARHKPFLHVSSRFPAARHCAALMVPLLQHPRNANGIVAFDLNADPEPLLSLDPDALHERLYQPRQESAPAPLGLKVVHLNRSPMVVTARVVTPALAERLQIDREAAERNWQRLTQSPELPATLTALYDRDYQPPNPVVDPELQLYDRFLDDADRRLADRARGSTPAELSSAGWPFADARMAELLFRYRARNWPQSLTDEERSRWREFVSERLHHPWREGALSLESARRRLQELLAGDLPADRRAALQDLQKWYGRLQASTNEA